MTKNKQGFTLIELVVVMAIIAVLVTLMVGAIIAARAQATATQITGDTKTYETALETFSASSANKGKYPYTATSGAVSGNLSAASSPALSTAYLSKTPTNTDVIYYFSGTETASGSGLTTNYTLIGCPAGYTTKPTGVTAGTMPDESSTGICLKGAVTAKSLYTTVR